MDCLPEIIELYAMMDPVGRDRLRSLAKQMQKRFPSTPKRSTLTLVQNTHDVQALDNVRDRRVNLFPVIDAGKAINGQ